MNPKHTLMAKLGLVNLSRIDEARALDAQFRIVYREHSEKMAALIGEIDLTDLSEPELEELWSMLPPHGPSMDRVTKRLMAIR